MPNRERVFDLKVASADGAVPGPGTVRLGLRFTERTIYQWEMRGFRLPTKSELVQGRTAQLKNLLWAGLEGFRDYHGEEREVWTIDEVNDLVERAGGWNGTLTDTLLAAYELRYPQEDKCAGKAPAPPPSSTAPTGERLSAPASAPA